MKIILLQDVKGVGKRNQTIEVKDGYANFLLNSGKALACSNKSQEIASKQIADEKKQYDLEVKKANDIKNNIEKLTLNFSLKTNNGQAFGSISNKQIIEKLESNGIKIDKFMIIDSNKTYGLGQHKIAIKLHKEVIAYLALRVTGE